MAHHVVVGARHDPDPAGVGVVRQALQVGDDVLGSGHGELAVGLHEVVLGIDIPEDDTGHGTFLG